MTQVEKNWRLHFVREVFWTGKSDHRFCLLPSFVDHVLPMLAVESAGRIMKWQTEVFFVPGPYQCHGCITNAAVLSCNVFCWLPKTKAHSFAHLLVSNFEFVAKKMFVLVNALTCRKTQSEADDLQLRPLRSKPRCNCWAQADRLFDSGWRGKCSFHLFVNLLCDGSKKLIASYRIRVHLLRKLYNNTRLRPNAHDSRHTSSVLTQWALSRTRVTDPAEDLDDSSESACSFVCTYFLQKKATRVDSLTPSTRTGRYETDALFLTSFFLDFCISRGFLNQRVFHFLCKNFSMWCVVFNEQRWCMNKAGSCSETVFLHLHQLKALWPSSKAKTKILYWCFFRILSARIACFVPPRISRKPQWVL